MSDGWPSVTRVSPPAIAGCFWRDPTRGKMSAVDSCRWLIGRYDRPWLLALLVAQLIWAGSAMAQQSDSANLQGSVPARVFQIVPETGHLLEDWDGLLPRLKDLGVEPTLTLVTDFAANPTGGESHGVTGPTSLGFSLLFDLDKIVGFKDSSFLMTGSDRWGHSLSADYIGNLLTTQQIYGYQTYRIIDVSYQQKLLDDKLEIRAGRFATLDDFLVSDYACLFMQLAFCGDPAGIALNSRSVTGYTGTWAVAMKVKPTGRSYLMAGVFNGDQGIRVNSRHGVDFSLNGPVLAIAEAGYQINGLPEDHSQRLGNYKLGAWYDDAVVPDFQSGAPTRGSWGVYALFDQVLVPLGPPAGNGGFGLFGAFLYAPNPHVQQIPVYLSAGVTLRGVFDEARPSDTFGLGAAYAKYSNKLPPVIASTSVPDSLPTIQDYETALEMTYRIYFDKNAVFFQPDLQYIIRPGGTGRIGNPVVIGFQSGINF